MSSLSQELFQELGQCRFGWSLSQWIYSRWLEGFPYGMTKASLKDKGEYPLRRGLQQRLQEPEVPVQAAGGAQQWDMQAREVPVMTGDSLYRLSRGSFMRAT